MHACELQSNTEQDPTYQDAQQEIAECSGLMIGNQGTKEDLMLQVGLSPHVAVLTWTLGNNCRATSTRQRSQCN